MLSGGQIQRILLARALYRRSTTLFLDEGTANLDKATEYKIANTISNMKITRIVIAHTPEILKRADRLFSMNDGELVEQSISDIQEG